MKNMKLSSRKDFFVIRGKLLYKDVNVPGELILKPLGVVTSDKQPLYGNELLEDIIIRGKAKNDRLLFAVHPCKREASHVVSHLASPLVFIQAVPYSDELELIEVAIEGEVIGSMNRSKKAQISAGTSVTDEGVQLRFNGSYDNMQVKAYDSVSDTWTHIYLDDEPKASVKRAIVIDWEQFPMAKTAVIEITATRGLDVARYRSGEIAVQLKPAKINIMCVGFRKIEDIDDVRQDLAEMESEAGKREQVGKKPRRVKEALYEYAFSASAYLHGIGLPASSLIWSILGKTYRGPHVFLQQEGTKPFKIKVTTTDPLGRETYLEEKIRPLELEKMYLQQEEKA